MLKEHTGGYTVVYLQPGHPVVRDLQPGGLHFLFLKGKGLTSPGSL